MTTTELPPLEIGGGDLRISLLTPSPAGNVESVRSSIIELSEPSEADESEQANEADRSTSPFPPPSQNIPVHPIPSLQDAFSESLDEATNGSTADKPGLRDLDVQGRREVLIAQDRYEPPFDARWRHRPGQKQHELLKLIAQISFGVYLLLHGMANSNAQVVNILQGHIDEVDEFLEVALEDLSQAADDLNGRTEHLKLPLANMQVFEQLLEDRKFRLEIIEGNEVIDHVLCRTNAALKQWDADIQAGLASTAAFTTWLKDEEESARRMDRADVADIFDAMKGNTEGWLTAFDDIGEGVQQVSSLVMRLSTIIGEMEKKAGEVSRKKWATVKPYSNPSLRSHGVNGPKAVSTRSGASSRQSTPRPSLNPKASTNASPMRSESPPDIDPQEDFPLPGSILPPPPSRSELRLTPDSASVSLKVGTPMYTSKQASQSAHELRLQPARDSSLTGGDSLYVLQPRTYAPESLETVPPAVKPKVVASQETLPGPSTATLKDSSADVDGDGFNQRRVSILGRVSLKTTPPEAIKIPLPRVAAATRRGASPTSETSRTSHSNPFDSAYGSDTDSMTQPVVSQVDSEHSMSSPRRPHVTHSPSSDYQQSYRRVHASPHSPLQQRPHTAVAGRRMSPMHSRNQPSAPAAGGVGTPNHVNSTTAAATAAAAQRPEDNDDAQTRVSATKTTATRTIKKKKSAFGWFKKAFTMDEDEKAAFEARRAMRDQDRYYEPNSPRFLDGRRIR